MNELLFFTGASIIVGLSYYLGREAGLKRNFKAEVKEFILGMTVARMTADYFERCARNETRQFLKFLGEKNPKEKFIIVPKIPTPEEFDKINRD
jgi:hypothetical protein